MSPAKSTTLDEAIAWMVRTRDPGFRDWAGFTAWLEADAARNDAYEAALDAHDLTGDLGVVPIAPVEAPDRRTPARWRAGWATAAAAVVVAAVAVPSLLPKHGAYVVATAPGEQRSLRLADGSVVAMNGGTRLTLDRNHARSVRLDTGEARFAVVHDPADPFVVATGDKRIEDVGTVFNVVRSGGATEIAVAEGAILYDPEGAGLKLTAGRTLRDPDRGMTEIGETDPAAVASWREGRLTYRNATIAKVAADVSRMTGETIRVAPTVAGRSFSGAIAVRGVPRERLLFRLGAMMGVAVTRDGDGWRLSPGNSAAR